jgi:hypothetical protein
MKQDTIYAGIHLPKRGRVPTGLGLALRQTRPVRNVRGKYGLNGFITAPAHSATNASGRPGGPPA